MPTDLIISKSIDIFSTASKVWEVLINPEMIKTNILPAQKQLQAGKLEAK